MVAAHIEAEPRPALQPEPVRPQDRIFNLDVLRGWAVLGILAVNAMAFAWPVALQMGMPVEPPYPHSPANILGHWVTDVFFHDKFRSLFSMLFGVSVFLVGGQEGDPARQPVLQRRLIWLAVFGLIHGAAIWYGDILLHYAYCGLILMVMRSWPGRRLLWIGGGLNLAFGLMAVGGGLAMGLIPGGGAGDNPFAPTAETLGATIAAYQSGWPSAQIENLKAWAVLQSASLFLIPVTVGLMMLGLGLFKTGFFSGRAPVWVYGLLVVLAGANLAVLGHYGWMEANAAPGADPSRGLAEAAAGLAPLITLGYASLLILMTRFRLKAVTGVLAPVGRMAFTNYLTQSLFMAGLFYLPGGPMAFGDPDWGPGRLWTAVLAIWALQLVWSPLWLAVFRMGPFEWLWRCVTYRRMLPILKERRG